MTRDSLPNRRNGQTLVVLHRDRQWSFGVSYFPDGRVAEVFSYVHYGTGSDVETEARDGSILLSLALQHGVTLESIAHSLTRDDRGVACGMIGAIVDVLMTLRQQ